MCRYACACPKTVVLAVVPELSAAAFFLFSLVFLNNFLRCNCMNLWYFIFHCGGLICTPQMCGSLVGMNRSRPLENVKIDKKKKKIENGT